MPETGSQGAAITVPNALAHYYEEIQRAGELCERESSRAPSHGFAPGFELPALDEHLRELFAPSTIRVTRACEHRGRKIRVLDLTGNPRTRTTKTFASLLIVARAVRHVRATGESILLVTPSSANKGGALRDAVARASECGLVLPHQLRIAVVVPRQGLSKLWTLPLSESPRARALNPVCHVHADDGRGVKDLTCTFVREHAALLERDGIRVWHTYDLDNYRMGDAVRAFVEEEQLGYPDPPVTRVHAQAVSSAFGLLGYQHGRNVLADRLGRDCGPPCRWLLVQHLGTPDLVLHHMFGSFSRENLPAYEQDPASGLLVQSEMPSFPARTAALDEVIDSTFYSHTPATATAVKGIQEQQGGTGIVVSKRECLERYPSLRDMFPSLGSRLPADPEDLREWALVMVLTGVLNAIERDLVPRASEVLVHATGSYGVSDYVPLPREHSIAISEADDLLRLVLEGGRGS